MRFRDRTEAADRLAARLSAYRGRRPLVLAVPRGAVPMARLIADRLEGDVDVVLVHKLGAPGQPELAIGSVDETGQVYLNEVAADLDVPAAYIEEETSRQVDALRRRRAMLTPVRAAKDPAGRIVIVVDDGIATGATMIAALRASRAKRPSRLVAVTAVAPPSAVARLEQEADEVVCLETPAVFFAVGGFFQDFREVTDDEVRAALGESGRTEAAPREPVVPSHDS